jgi:hypothetical protein
MLRASHDPFGHSLIRLLVSACSVWSDQNGAALSGEALEGGASDDSALRQSLW